MIFNWNQEFIIGASLSEPHTSWKTVCTSVTYTAIMNEKIRWQSYVWASRKWIGSENVAVKRVYERHVNGLRAYGGRFRAFLSYFPVTCHLFPCYFPNISHFPTISQLFLSYLSKISHFQTISGLFLSHFLLLDYFASTSQWFLKLDYFPVISRLFPGYSSSCEDGFLTFRTTCLTWFAQ